jgi:hypothetical protein
MQLCGDCFPPIDKPTAATLCYWFGEEVNFGEWMELRDPGGQFIRMDSSDEVMVPEEFEDDNFDPMNYEELWVLQWGKGQHQRHLAEETVTTKQALRAFLSFLKGDERWRATRSWRPLPRKRKRRT